MRKKTFIKISNEDIYQAINEIRGNLNLLLQKNEKAHQEMFNLIDRVKGSIRLVKWTATTSLSLVLIVIGALLNYILKG